MVIECQIPIQLPIIDISQPLEPSSLSSVVKACKEWGFFHITNHGIPDDLYMKIRFLSEQMFSLSDERKNKLGPFSSEKTYTPHYIASPFFESLKVSGPDFDRSAQSSADVLFHQHNSEFRPCGSFESGNSEKSSPKAVCEPVSCELLQEYGSKMTELSKKIVKLLLHTFGDGVEKKYYSSGFENCHGYLRIINYSPPDRLDKEVEGLGKHTDMSCVTIVYQDKIGGLQVKLNKGNWVDISPCKGTLVVNIGDMLQAWSNEKLRSSQHRVVLKKLVNRFSLAFFWCFENEKVILAPDGVVGEGEKRVYRPFICSDYLKFRESNQKGKFEKVGLTVEDFAGIEYSEWYESITTVLPERKKNAICQVVREISKPLSIKF